MQVRARGTEGLWVWANIKEKAGHESETLNQGAEATITQFSLQPSKSVTESMATPVEEDFSAEGGWGEGRHTHSGQRTLKLVSHVLGDHLGAIT